MKILVVVSVVLLSHAMPSVQAQTLAERIAAASWTAENEPLCDTTTAISPFYWEIGDRTGLQGSGSVGKDAPLRTKFMSIASATKWVYAAYVAQKFGGNLSSYDVRFLTMSSGYVGMGEHQCNYPVSSSNAPLTVDQCLMHDTNASYLPAADGLWIYNSGHFENHAVHAGFTGPGNVIDLGAYDSGDLGTEVQLQLGPGFPFSQPLLAGGIFTNSKNYAEFLQKIIDVPSTPLQIYWYLGTNARCTNSTDPQNPCPGTILLNHNPVPVAIFWDYSIGHWVEADPDHPSLSNGDGSYSSAGSRGFYPWIDATKTWYGILARDVDADEDDHEGWKSYLCGQKIRAAWMTASHQ